MTTRTSIIDLQNVALTLRADEAVAIAQQLIHNLPNDRQLTPDQPYGPPTLANVFLDDEGLVTCHACQATPSVAEMAILLQRLLPPGTPKVPGALRYTIARALHEVDAPPFDSIHDFSSALERFESGDRTAIVRALVGRATAVALDRLRVRNGEDRRRLMPSSTDFRRELRAADARYYELASATGQIVLAAPKQPAEQRRSPTLVAGVLAGACLVFVGEVMHTRSEPPPAPPVDMEFASPTIAQELPDDPSPRPVLRTVAAPMVTVTKGESSSKAVVKRAVRRQTHAAPSTRERRTKNGQGVMDRLHLGWLRNAFTIRQDPL